MNNVTYQNDQSTVCAIMQPTFLPWLGYFNLISRVEKFVFLDDVQLSKQSWQTRNKLFTGRNVNWVSCPISKKTSNDTRICDVSISQNTNWRSKLIKTIKQNYTKTPFFNDCLDLLSIIESAPTHNLSVFNQHIIMSASTHLDLNTKFVVASDLECGGKKSHHLLEICRAINANHYLSPKGAQEYIEEEGVLVNELDSITYQNYVPRPYVQHHSSEFVSHLSIVDAVANIGWNATKQHITGTL